MGLRHLGHEERRGGRPARRAPRRDRCAASGLSTCSWVFYDCEEVDAARNGLGRLARERPDALHADLAILLEPTNGLVEGGCQGTLRADRDRDRQAGPHARAPGAGSTRSTRPRPSSNGWPATAAARSTIDGLHYREGLNAVAISGGVAGNVDPGRVHGHGQLPVRARPQRAPRRPTTSASCSASCGGRDRRLGAGRAAGPRQPAGPGLPRRGRRPAAGQARLDGRGPLRRTRRPGAELRPGRPRARAHPRGARGHRADRCSRGRARPLPGRGTAVTATTGEWVTPTARAAGAPARPGDRAALADPARHGRPAAARLARPVRVGAHRPVAGAADPERVRRGLRAAGRSARGGVGVRLGPHAPRQPRVRDWASSSARRWPGPATP